MRAGERAAAKRKREKEKIVIGSENRWRMMGENKVMEPKFFHYESFIPLSRHRGVNQEKTRGIKRRQQEGN